MDSGRTPTNCANTPRTIESIHGLAIFDCVVACRLFRFRKIMQIEMRRIDIGPRLHRVQFAREVVIDYLVLIDEPCCEHRLRQTGVGTIANQGFSATPNKESTVSRRLALRELE